MPGLSSDPCIPLASPSYPLSLGIAPGFFCLGRCHTCPCILARSSLEPRACHSSTAGLRSAARRFAQSLLEVCAKPFGGLRKSSRRFAHCDFEVSMVAHGGSRAGVCAKPLGGLRKPTGRFAQAALEVCANRLGGFSFWKSAPSSIPPFSSRCLHLTSVLWYRHHAGYTHNDE